MRKHIMQKLILHIKGWEPELWKSNILVWDINNERPAIIGKTPKLIQLPTEAWTNAVQMSPETLRTIHSPHINSNALPLSGAREGISIFQGGEPAPLAAS